MKYYCTFSEFIPTRKINYKRDMVQRFSCSKTFVNCTDSSISPIFFYCIVFKDDYYNKEELVKFKYIDLFKEMTGCPHYVIWSVIALQCLFIVMSCLWCSCKKKE